MLEFLNSFWLGASSVQVRCGLPKRPCTTCLSGAGLEASDPYFLGGFAPLWPEGISRRLHYSRGFLSKKSPTLGGFGKGSHGVHLPRELPPQTSFLL